MVFDNFAYTVLEVGANFTTIGRVVWVNGRPFDGRLAAFACQIPDLRAGAGACLYYFHLPGGQVTGTGDVRDGIEFPITGETGGYVGVADSMLYPRISGSPRSRMRSSTSAASAGSNVVEPSMFSGPAPRRRLHDAKC
jgi:hypothetical protein